MATKTKLSTADAATLERLGKRATDCEGKIRSADQNLSSFDEFIEEADAMIALPSVSQEEKDRWAARKLHCQTVQTADENNRKAVAQALLAPAKTALDAEKTRLGAEKGDDGWYVG
jgi:hypothetical protein